MQHQGAGATDITLKCVIDLEKKNKKEKKSEVSYYLQRSLTYPPDIITKASILLLFRKYMYLTSYKHFQLCALVSY